MPDAIWLTSYPPGVPKSIDPDAYPSLHALLLDACRRYGERPAFDCLSATITYAEWERDSRSFAAFLREEAECRPGDRIAIMLPNVLAYPVAFLGTLRAGLTVVNVNPLYTPRELEHQLKDSGAKLIVIMENFAHKLASMIANTPIEHVVVARLGDLVPPLKRWAFNFANTYIRHAVPPWDFERYTMLQDACERPPSSPFCGRATARFGAGVAAIHRRNDRRAERRDPVSSQPDCEHAAVPSLDWYECPACGRAGAHTVATLPYLLAYGEHADLCIARGFERARPRPARPPPTDRHHASDQCHGNVGCEHVV